MKLLFDQNLSPKLAEFFKESFDDCAHAKDIGLVTSTRPKLLIVVENTLFLFMLRKKLKCVQFVDFKIKWFHYGFALLLY